MRTRLYDARKRDAGVTVDRITWAVRPHDAERTSRFGIYWVESGAGRVEVELTAHPFRASSLVFVSPPSPRRL